MIFNTTSGHLAKSLQKIAAVVNPNNLLPILGNYKLSLTGNTLTITASDMETVLTATLEVEGQQDGAICVNARILTEYTRTIADQAITFTLSDNNAVTLKTKSGKQKLVGESAALFPNYETGKPQHTVTLPTELLTSALSAALVAVSDGKAGNPLFAGVNFGSTEVMGCDGSHGIMVAHGVSTATLNYDDNWVSIELPALRISIKLMDGRYPDVRSVTPTDNPIAVQVDREALLNAIKCVSLSANKITSAIAMKITENEIRVEGTDVRNSTEATESVTCTSNAEIEIGVNAHHLRGLLGALTADEITLQLSTPTRAIVIANENVTTLIMPIMIAE